MKNLVKLFIIFLIFEGNIFSQMKWEEVNSPYQRTVNRVVNVNDTIMLAGMKSGSIYLSQNSGANWNQIREGSDTDPYPDIEDLVYFRDKIILVSVYNKGLLRTTNHGANWETILPLTGQLLKIDTTTVLFAPNSPSPDLLISNDKGATWIKISAPDMNPTKLCLGSNRSTIFGIFGTKFFASYDTAKTWSLRGDEVPNGIKSFVQAPNGNFFAIDNKSVYQSLDGGETWVVDNLILENPKLSHISMIDDSTVVVAHFKGLSRKTLNSQNWSNVLKSSDVSPYHFSVALDGSFLLLADRAGVVKYQNNTFMNISTGLPQDKIWSVAVYGDTIVCSTQYGLYISVNKGENWSKIETSQPPAFTRIFLFPPNIIALYYGIIYHSSNMGETWTTIHNGQILSAFGIGFSNRIFAANYYDPGGGPPEYAHMRYSDDFGVTWRNSNIGELYPEVKSIKTKPDGKIYAVYATYTWPILQRFHKISISANNGASFDNGFVIPESITDAQYSRSRDGYFLTSMNQLFFQPADSTNYTYTKYIYSLQYLIEGKDMGIYYTEKGVDLITYYVSYIPPTGSFNSISIDSQFDGGPKGKFFKDEADNIYICSNTTIYKAIYDPTDVKEITETEEPNQRHSIGFFPNPFTSQGNLEVHSPEIQNAKIDMYNILGQEVLSIFNGDLAIGTNSFDIAGNKLTSGIYIIRVQTPKEINTLKVILMR